MPCEWHIFTVSQHTYIRLGTIMTLVGREGSKAGGSKHRFTSEQVFCDASPGRKRPQKGFSKSIMARTGPASSIFDAEAFISSITRHIPEKSFQLVRNYGGYFSRALRARL